MITIDYEALIDGLNDESFRECVGILYPHLGYRFLQPGDVRRIDLKEKVVAMAVEYVPVKKKEPWPTALKYIEALNFAFENGYMECEKGSIAEAYRKRAVEIIKAIKDEKTEMSSLEDLFMIYMCLSRELYPEFKKASEVTFGLKNEDARLIENLYEYQFKADTFIGTKAGSQSEKQKRFAYINNVLMYCRLMEIQRTHMKGSEA